MENTREIQNRIKSVQDTMKITNAMYMVSSSKLQKARRWLAETEPFFNMIQEVSGRILKEAPEVGDRYFDTGAEKTGKEKVGYLVITADKGLAGAYNNNIIKMAEKNVKQNADNMLFVVGEVGRAYFEKKNIPIDTHFRYTAQDPTMNRARHISEQLVGLFLEGRLDVVYVMYTRTVNSLTVEPVISELLPLRKSEKEELIKNTEGYYARPQFLPDAQTVFDTLVPDYVAVFIYGALIESFCSEHNSRMIAMQNATNAATDLLKELDVQYNRARQAAITQEITEIIAGVRAQKNKGKKA